MNAVGVERAVLIQPSLYGFDHSYLIACLQEHPSRFVGVALADPLDTHFRRRLESIVQDAPIRGVRFAPLIDPSRPWFAPEAEPLVNMITEQNLTICLLISPAQLEESANWIARHPASRIVIDHLARPDLGSDGPELVLDRLARLSEFPNVWVKLSALSELSREPYPHRDAAAWARRTLADFGPERLMWGSDFPFVSGTERYGASWSALREALEDTSASVRRHISADTAAEVFRLPVTD
jgi:predicted TIM-barrel fold metal-dependent hydrolase